MILQQQDVSIMMMIMRNIFSFLKSKSKSEKKRKKVLKVFKINFIYITFFGCAYFLKKLFS